MKSLMVLILFAVSISGYSEEVLHFNAKYKIPAPTPELDLYTAYELVDYTVIKDGKNSKVQYILPFEMTGYVDQKVDLKLVIEKLPLRVFEGPRAIALCEGAWAQMKCSVRFKAISMHYGRIEKNLISEGFPAQVIADKMTVLRSFGGEPIGETFISTSSQ